MESLACFFVPTNMILPPRCASADSELLRVEQRLLGLEKVDDVDAVDLAVDETAHLRVPTAGLVSEVDASQKQAFEVDCAHALGPSRR